MSKYNCFLLLFIVSVAAFVVFMVFYLKAFFGLAMHAEELSDHSYSSPLQFMATIFTPELIISFIVTAACSLCTRVLGIVWVIKNKTVTDGEKALWIIGFIMMGFVTAIVFLILAKSRKFVE